MGGAPVPVFNPTRAAVRRVREELIRGTRVQCALDSHERPMHCHHEKLVIIDGEVAFVGGIDLTSLGGDRFDTSDASDARPARMARRLEPGSRPRGGRRRGATSPRAGARSTGERLEQTERRRRRRPLATSSSRSYGPSPSKVYDFLPQGDFRILEAYTRALRSARRLVYLESQFLWSPQIVEILAGKLREPPSEAFRVVVLLPAKPNNGADMTRGQLGVLADADDGNGRFLAATITARSGALAGPLYVHAKIGIVDDTWLTVGSANLNDHSFFNDTEMNVVTCDPALARDTRLRLWSEHLERSARGGLRRPGANHRRAVAADRVRTTRTPAPRRSAHPSAARAPRSLAPFHGAPRTL